MSAKMLLRSVLFFDISAIIFALFIGNPPEQHFGERGFITYLSFIQLLVISGLSWKIFTARNTGMPASGILKAPFFIWLIASAAFVYFALDEILMIHERTDFFIHRFFKMKETYLTDRIDDAIVMCYGLAALAGFYLYRREFQKYKGVFPLFRTGIIFVLFMIVGDILTNNVGFIEDIISVSESTKASWMWVGAIEDMFKIIAEGIFMVVSYRCLEIAKKIAVAPS